MKHNYIPVIDGLRAVAILLVLITHFWRNGPVVGGLGVTLFFFISGFLITGLLIDELRATSRINFAAFYWRRFRRLAPAMLLMVMVIFAVYWFGFGIWLGDEAVAGVFYVTNYVSISETYFSLVFGALWSLAVEEHFYLLFPLVMALGWRFGYRLLGGLLLLCMLVLLWRCYLVGYGHGWRIYHSTDTRIDSILYGCVLAIALRLQINLTWLAQKSVLLLAVALLAWGTLVKDPAFRNTLRYTVQGLAFIPLFYRLVYGGENWLTQVLQNPLMIWIGKLSYSLYLWHYPILDLCREHLPTSKLSQLIVAAVTSLLLSVFSYYCVEKPLRYAAKRPQALLA
jgi:peptidoglycan/LPS O-acetylase OafA/YrhL